jgi:parallel beta-helix repeat protein
VSRLLARLALLSAPCLVIALTPAVAEAATSYWVDATNAMCTDLGTGTAAAPFCTINAAAKKAINAGDVVQVQPGDYREQVTVAGSGAAGGDITFRAVAPGVNVIGTRSLSDAAGWSAVAGSTAWSRPYAPPSAPKQVFIDGARLASAASSAALTPNSFFYDAVAKVLYVDLGGPNPADGHVVEAGAQTYGFLVSGKSHIVIDGFATQGQNSNGVRVTAGASAVTVHGVTATRAGINGLLVDTSTGGNILLDSNTVSGSASVGIRLSASTGVTVRGNSSSANLLHGFALANADANIITGNTSRSNAAPAGATTATGFDINTGSENNVITGNFATGNQDSGFQTYNGSNGNLLARNVSWANGDHGFDTKTATGTRYVSDTAYGNHTDGFSVEGTATTTSIYNSIATDSGEFDLWVDTLSASGFSSDRDIFYNSQGGTTMVSYNGTKYPSLSAFASATGQEAHGRGVDPRFASAATGDLSLSVDSPALDAADSSVSGFTAADPAGNLPADDPNIPDTGAGVPAFADLGAYERLPQPGDPADRAPAAALTVNPTAAAVPPSALITANASGSSDIDGTPIASYAFDFGDGTTIAASAQPIASHSYSTVGTYTVTVTVTDTAAQSSTATRTVTITARPLVDYHVSKTNPSCSDAGAGGAAQPFCTINAGAKKALAGDRVLVDPATYREQVTVLNTGQTGYPVVFMATAPGVNLVGSNDVSDPAAWSTTATSAWSRPYTATNPPAQVFLDGARLTPAASATSTTNGSWFYDAAAGLLYVDIGGANPGSGHLVEAGAQTYGFKAWSINNLLITGFTITEQNSAGVSLQSNQQVTTSNNVISLTGTYGVSADTVSGSSFVSNTVARSGSVGIRLLSSPNATVSGNISHDNGFHGISLQFSPGGTISGNTAYNNIKPDVRSANGIDVELNSTGATVTGNRTYNNQDSGIQVYSGSNDSTANRNITYGNGDHGIDILNATGVRVIGNTSYANNKDGLSVEGTSTNTTVADNILVDNGLTTKEFNLYVDVAAVSGTNLDRDLNWNSSASTAVKYNGTLYPTLANFKAAVPGQEVHGVDASPRFVSAATGDFRLTSISPAIDTADASVAGFAANDFSGQPPVDDPSVANTGAGVPTYADLGALEYRGPAATLVLTPATGKFPLSVSADATGSVALGAPIVSYTIACGTGTTFGPGPNATATCAYPVAGTYQVTLTVTDAAGLSDQAIGQVSATDDAPTAALSASPQGAFAPQVVVLDASQSKDLDGTPIATYLFNCGNGTVSAAQTSAQFSCNYMVGGTFSARVTVTDTAGLSSVATVSVLVKPDAAPVASLRATPSTVTGGATVTLDARGSTDVDKTPIASYRFDCGNGKIVGPQAGATATCTYPSAAATYDVSVRVTDTAGLVTTASAKVTVKKK